MIPVSNMHNFFAALSPEVQAEFEQVSTFRSVREGDMIIRSGGVCRELYQLREGSVKYSACDYQGRETVIAFMKPGDWIGLSELFTGLPAMSDVLATTPVRLRAIRQRDFEALMDRHPVIARQLLRLFSLRFSTMYYQGMDRGALSLKERLLKTLYMLSFSHGQHDESSDEILIEMSQDELSKMLVASRQNLNRALKELEREGLLRLGYGAIRVLGLEGINRHYGYLVNVNQPAPAYGA